jgi:hypothetical protein
VQMELGFGKAAEPGERIDLLGGVFGTSHCSSVISNSVESGLRRR